MKQIRNVNHMMKYIVPYTEDGVRKEYSTGLRKNARAFICDRYPKRKRVSKVSTLMKREVIQ